jgi:hypothetical protein
MEKTRRREPLEQRLELLLGHTALSDDGVYRPAGQVSRVHRYDRAELPLGVYKEKMARATLAVRNEAGSLQRLDYLLRGEAPEVLHAAGAWICTNASAERVSSGMGRPSSAREERYSSMASWAIFWACS